MPSKDIMQEQILFLVPKLCQCFAECFLSIFDENMSSFFPFLRKYFLLPGLCTGLYRKRRKKAHKKSRTGVQTSLIRNMLASFFAGDSADDSGSDPARLARSSGSDIIPPTGTTWILKKRGWRITKKGVNVKKCLPAVLLKLGHKNKRFIAIIATCCWAFE